MRRWLLLGLIVLVSCWRRPAPPAPDRQVSIGLQPEAFSLANGLRVVLVRDPRASQLQVTMVYGAGASDDPADAAGTAHLVEHVLFEPVGDGGSLLTRLRAVALDVNGFTGPDTTAYTARVWPDRLAGVLALEAERMAKRCETVSDAGFVRAREIVRNERREHGGSWDIRASLDQALFPDGHPYHRAAATLAGLATITRDAACAFADAHYGPGNAVLVVGGPVTHDELARALAGTLAQVQRDVAVAHREPAAIAAGRDTFAAPLTSPALLVTWPVPDDPVRRAEAEAVVVMIAHIVQTQVNGEISVLGLGGASGHAFSIVIFLAPEDTADSALAGIERAEFRLQDWFGSGLFEVARERAVYAAVAEVAGGARRDAEIADDVLAGRDPGATLAARVAALHALSRDDAKAIAEHLTLATAHVTHITPDDHPATVTASLAPPIDVLPAPITADPQAAHRASDAPARDPLSGLRTRTLPNGLRVVLMPSTSIHTFDARLVIPAGTGNEPAAERGVALLSAHALSPNPGDGSAMLRFYMGGGAFDVNVGFDSTTFATGGLAGELDHALVALEQLVGDGVYSDLAATRHRLAADPEPELLFTRLWRRALYGEDHPYVDAGLWRRATVSDTDVVLVFRAMHYVPQGATLVVVGGFDPDLADRWVDYAFADWHGDAPAARVAPAAPQPFAFSQARAGQSLAIRIAFPSHAPEAAALVVTEMVSRAVADVREELAASYGVSANLAQTHAGDAIVIAGHIDAARAGDACALIRDRLTRLRETSADTDARFVEARRTVIDDLVTRPAAPGALADRLETVIARGAAPDDAPRTAEAARRLTVDDVAPLLRTLDLDDAAMLITGPQPALDAAFAALGRRATKVN